MQDKIQSVIDGLTSLKANLRDLDSVKSELTAAKAELAATQKAHAEAADRLKDKNTSLESDLARTIAEHNKEMFAKTKELRTLTESVAAKTAELDQLRAEVNTAHRDHDGVLASIESLKKRLG